VIGTIFFIGALNLYLNKDAQMKTVTIVGIVLLTLGIISLAYEGISYTTQKEVVDIGPIHATKNQEHTIPLPPVLGGLMMAGGVVLLASGLKKTRN
jgi:hypothetical protein